MAKAKMTGLGKGLDALFGGSPLDVQMEENIEEVQEIDDNKNLKTLNNALKQIKKGKKN